MKKIEPMPWRGVRAGEIIVLSLLPLMAAAVLAVPFLDQVIIRRVARLSALRPVVIWLANGYAAWITGAVLVLLFFLFLFYIRRRLLGNKRLWFGTGCPQCMERELVRVSRTAADRGYGLIGVPAYRYACRNCTWRGLRIARREHSPERDAELEASLMRFDPGLTLEVPADVADDTTGADKPAAINRSSSLDPGDVDLIDQSQLATPEEQEEPISSAEGAANDHGDAEPVDGMEWLWRHASDR
ncbi:MAG: hypothetical protein KA586_09000 [Candidatus Promineofilum sp.]|nr:hypothetical protein [Promineifilum sp.]